MSSTVSPPGLASPAPTAPRPRPFGRNYAFVVVGVIFLCLLAAAGLRASPGVLILPLEQAFGWSRSTTSFAAGLGIFLYGLVGPFAAALMQSFGIRRTLLCALALMATSTALSALMSEPWHLIATWGVLSGLGSGCVAIVLGATVVNRWFAVRRGLFMGLLTASTATGTLIFLPGLAAIAQAGGWRPVVLTVACVIAALIPLVAWLLPERPSDIGLTPYGAAPGTVSEPPRRANPFKAAIDGLVRASAKGDFWLLFGTFFICGLTTNGLVGTHLISFCADQGIPEVRAAGLLALMGVFDLIGTTGSGWLTDRYDPRKLLFVYYGLRGLSLMALPFTDFSFYSLSIFAVFYGLDWIATVPPTVRLANEAFGERDAPIVFGWIAAGHQLGAATAAFGAGLVRASEGRYLEAFLAAGLTAVMAALMSLMIGRMRQASPAAA
ncbi:MFS transporter [Methylobacterium aquaticum]|uniref:MFS transporter n=1 Tax=Methylobacterium aquaticum TaxID=270351 RepID=UPI0019344D93|nr:MFS transporter [Methylobacterium aquaticum]QRE76556.1 MFS transporter [Methylobacterium aquaticum]